jgi:hypothetical protein
MPSDSSNTPCDVLVLKLYKYCRFGIDLAMIDVFAMTILYLFLPHSRKIFFAPLASVLIASCTFSFLLLVNLKLCSRTIYAAEVEAALQFLYRLYHKILIASAVCGVSGAIILYFLFR